MTLRAPTGQWPRQAACRHRNVFVHRRPLGAKVNHPQSAEPGSGGNRHTLVASTPPRVRPLSDFHAPPAAATPRGRKAPTSTANQAAANILSEEPCTRDPYGWDLDVVLHDVAAINRAVALCERCPVFTACREGALRRGERESTAPRSVIWGGLVWGQRGEPWTTDVAHSARLAHAARNREQRRLLQQSPGRPAAESPQTAVAS